jgi:glycosyltransferase involved in cell wall biosynthesis
MNSGLLISVIVTTKNEERNIANCLESVKKQTVPIGQFEIIVVDNDSQDQTRAIAARYTDRVYTKGPERSAQRNYGAELAQGKYILFLDADMMLTAGVLEECLTRCERDAGVGLYIPEQIVGTGFWIKVRNFERGFYDGTCIDAVRFMRRDLFLKIGGFDVSFFVAEDWDLNRRLAGEGRLAISRIPLLHNEGEFRVGPYIRKKIHYIKSFDGYISKWGAEDPLVKKQVGAAYRFWGVFVENGNWKRLVRHPLLTGAMYFLRFWIGVSFILFKKNGIRKEGQPTISG